MLWVSGPANVCDDGSDREPSWLDWGTVRHCTIQSRHPERLSMNYRSSGSHVHVGAHMADPAFYVAVALLMDVGSEDVRSTGGMGAGETAAFRGLG